MLSYARIFIPLSSDRQYFRDVLCGIARYARANATWILEAEPTHTAKASLDAQLQQADGVILFLKSEQQLALLRQAGTPFVNLSRMFLREDVLSVLNDAPAIAQLAFEHFRERGFEQFAYCELDIYSHFRSEPFRQIVESAGYECHLYRVAHTRRAAWRNDERALDRWIQGLPKPIAILAHNDVRGRHVSNACRRLQIPVPDEVAILGVDNELPHCDLCNPPLSSVATDATRIGYEAAYLLHEQLHGRQPSGANICIPPTGVIVRQSTDVQAIEDQVVSQALRFIRDRACLGIRVPDVVEHVLVSRTALDQRFRAALGRTPHEEIVRVRLGRAKQLLIETNWTLEAIAEKSGFRHGEYLGVAFQKHFAQTPGEFRTSMVERRRA